MIISKNLLKQYNDIVHEINETEERIIKLERNEPRIEYGSVKASQQEFPYVEQHVHIEGYNIKNDEEHRGKIENYKMQLKKHQSELIEQEAEIMKLINSIPNSSDRRILTLYCVDGLIQEQIAPMVHLDRSTVSRRIKKYCELK